MAPCSHYSTFLPKLFLFTLLLLTYTKSLLTHDDECMALYLFKQSFPLPTFEAPGFQNFDSWKITSNASNDDGSDCCLWDGVACSDEEDGGHVIGLDLSGRFLRGHINSSSTLFNLVHLQMLNLAMNDFTGSQIPSQISRLKQLRSLDLSDAGLSGQIPSEISHLMQLSLLDLSGNSLKLQSPSLEKLVQNLTRLEELDLSGVEVSSSVPHFLANFSSMRSVSLKNCSLQNDFPMAILQLPKLIVLDVSYNTNLTGFLPEFHNNSLLEGLFLHTTGFSGIIPKSIKKLNHLVVLSLGNCSFSGPIPSSVANLTQLVLLDLSQNKFSGVVPSLASLTELIALNISVNNFEKGSLPDWLGKLTTLIALSADETNLHGEIPPFLANLTELMVFSVKKNPLSGPIPHWFTNLTQLSQIDLRENELRGAISSSFSNFKGLQFLDLAGNRFSGMVDLDRFLRLNKLKALSLGGNKISVVVTKNYTNDTLPQLTFLDLSSCNLKEYPAFLRFQHNLTLLKLAENEIGGLIPEWSWNNSKKTLQLIDLSHNFITGFHQHQHFVQWVSLKIISIAYNQLQGQIPIPPITTFFYDVSHNNLGGEIPPLLCELKSLRVLSLSDNNITGILPPCFGSLSNSLVMLDLKRNNLEGTMINSFTQKSPLKFLDLSKNKFTGQVAKSLTNCTNLEVLSLGDNSLDGVFPFWLGTLDGLVYLSLQSNKFYGKIQGPTNASSQFPKLRIIDLSNNGFNGRLPDKYFRTWNAMKSGYVEKSSILQFESPLETIDVDFPLSSYRRLKIFSAIDLSCNNFEGEIPQSIGDLRGLESLNLSNNHLSGRVLSSLGNLKNLIVLDLSQNKLSGEIPHQLLQLAFLQFLNVSFNHLEGPIPLGKLNMFNNKSYLGNPGLCGKPLSKECRNSKVLTPPQRSSKSESFLPHESVDWIVVLSGVGSGLVVGIVIGNFLYARYHDWFIERFGMRKNKWVRPLSNKRRNQAL